MIYWKSENIKDWSPEARCNTVSPKFDQAFLEGRLNYITTGKVGNSDVLCSIAKEGEICNGKNQLFTINTYQKPEEVLNQMAGFFQGQSGVIYQSGGKKYIKINLENLAKQEGVEIISNPLDHSHQNYCTKYDGVEGAFICLFKSGFDITK